MNSFLKWFNNEPKEYRDGLNYYERRGQQNNQFWLLIASLFLIAAVLQWPEVAVEVALWVLSFLWKVSVVTFALLALAVLWHFIKGQQSPDDV